jgi:hypothetical protein
MKDSSTHCAYKYTTLQDTYTICPVFYNIHDDSTHLNVSMPHFHISLQMTDFHQKFDMEISSKVSHYQDQF